MLIESSVLSSAAPDVPAEAIEHHLLHHYGLKGELSVLNGERDRNYQLIIHGLPKFVVKVAHPLEGALAIEAQSLAANHVRSMDATVPVQRVLLSAQGRTTTLLSECGQDRVVRVVDWLPGQVMAATPLSTELATSVGRTLARLGRALSNFTHAHASQDLLWDLSNAARLGELLPYLTDASLRLEVERALDAYVALLPDLRALPKQVIHGDFNPHNLVVDSTGTSLVGVLDFGDMQMGPTICDLAIACSYLTGEGDRRFEFIEATAAAYHREQPLQGGDASMLVGLIAMRHAMTILITGWRASRHPENSSYILRNYPAARRGLSALSGTGRGTLAERLANILA